MVSDESCSLILRVEHLTAHRGVGKRSDLQMYGTSKLYNVLAVKEIGKRLRGALHCGIFSRHTHPLCVIASPLLDSMRV